MEEALALKAAEHERAMALALREREQAHEMSLAAVLREKEEELRLKEEIILQQQEQEAEFLSIIESQDAVLDEREAELDEKAAGLAVKEEQLLLEARAVLERTSAASDEGICTDAIEERFDPHSGTKYFYNSSTGISGWTREEAMATSARRSSLIMPAAPASDEDNTREVMDDKALGDNSISYQDEQSFSEDHISGVEPEQDLGSSSEADTAEIEAAAATEFASNTFVVDEDHESNPMEEYNDDVQADSKEDLYMQECPECLAPNAVGNKRCIECNSLLTPVSSPTNRHDSPHLLPPPTAASVSPPPIAVAVPDPNAQETQSCQDEETVSAVEESNEPRPASPAESGPPITPASSATSESTQETPEQVSELAVAADSTVCDAFDRSLPPKELILEVLGGLFDKLSALTLKGTDKRQMVRLLISCRLCLNVCFVCSQMREKAGKFCRQS
jgi:hypothetical protein